MPGTLTCCVHGWHASCADLRNAARRAGGSGTRVPEYPSAGGLSIAIALLSGDTPRCSRQQRSSGSVLETVPRTGRRRRMRSRRSSQSMTPPSGGVDGPVDYPSGSVRVHMSVRPNPNKGKGAGARKSRKGGEPEPRTAREDLGVRKRRVRHRSVNGTYYGTKKREKTKNKD